MKTKSQAQIARDLGISPAYLCQILTGKVKISYKLAYQWSKKFEPPMDWWKNATPKEIRSALNNKANTPHDVQQG